MGNDFLENLVEKNNNIFRKNPIKDPNSLLNEQVKCPFCEKVFPSNKTIQEFNIHIKHCGLTSTQIDKACELVPPSQDYELNSKIFINCKKYIPSAKSKFSIQQTLDEKISKLKSEILSKKISWEEGFCQLNLTRNNLLKESMTQIKNVDLKKELKINFKGEVSYDAGGIMREWFTTVFQTLEADKLKLFIISDSNEFSYIINPFLSHNKENLEYFAFIGKLIAKALFDNITVNICFNKLIYKMILQEEINFNDLLFIDYTLYTSLKNLKEIGLSQNNNLEVYYSIEMKDVYNHTHSLELVNKGREIPLTNIDDYIKKRINFMIGLYEPFIKEIRDNIYAYFSKEVITSFTSDEFELILNGRPFIDIEEWKIFTEYKEPYNANHYIIKWFWDILKDLNQKELSNILLFATGSGRVPLGGFAVLESNRGNISRFRIEMSPYQKGCKNFIKAHTCFNRIDIPLYKKKEEMVEMIKFIANQEILGFGID